MADVVNGPDFQYATPVVLSDTVDNAVGACGIRKQGGADGNINVIFANGEGPVTLRLSNFTSAFCPLRRILSTGTTAQVEFILALY